jgi:hypothetical protein
VFETAQAAINAFRRGEIQMDTMVEIPEPKDRTAVLDILRQIQ